MDGFTKDGVITIHLVDSEVFILQIDKVCQGHDGYRIVITVGVVVSKFSQSLHFKEYIFSLRLFFAVVMI